MGMCVRPEKPSPPVSSRAEVARRPPPHNRTSPDRLSPQGSVRLGASSVAGSREALWLPRHPIVWLVASIEHDRAAPRSPLAPTASDKGSPEALKGCLTETRPRSSLSADATATRAIAAATSAPRTAPDRLIPTLPCTRCVLGRGRHSPTRREPPAGCPACNGTPAAHLQSRAILSPHLAAPGSDGFPRHVHRARPDRPYGRCQQLRVPRRPPTDKRRRLRVPRRVLQSKPPPIPQPVDRAIAQPGRSGQMHRAAEHKLPVPLATDLRSPSRRAAPEDWHPRPATDRNH